MVKRSKRIGYPMLEHATIWPLDSWPLITSLFRKKNVSLFVIRDHMRQRGFVSKKNTLMINSRNLLVPFLKHFSLIEYFCFRYHLWGYTPKRIYFNRAHPTRDLQALSCKKFSLIKHSCFSYNLGRRPWPLENQWERLQLLTTTLFGSLILEMPFCPFFPFFLILFSLHTQRSLASW